ncbi:MAG TPA: O-antigen ligase family protein [bacterium]|nr:O-antigen ligase family protein [bacterium]
MKKIIVYKTELTILLFWFILSYFKAFGLSAYSILSVLGVDSITISTLINYAVIIIISLIIIQTYKYFFIKKFSTDDIVSKNSDLNKHNKNKIKLKKKIPNENNFDGCVLDICLLLTVTIIGITLNVKESLVIKESMLFFFAAYILLKCFYLKIQLNFNSLASFFLIYTIYLFFLSFFSQYPHYSFRFCLNYLCLTLIIIYVSSNINCGAQIRKIMDYAYFSGIIFVIVYCLQFTDFWQFENIYDCFTLGNKNYFIDYLTIIAALSMYNLITHYHNKILFAVNILALTALIFIFFFLNSYFGFLALGILFLIFFIKLFLKLKSFKIIIVFCFTIIAACIFVFFYIPNTKLKVLENGFFESSSFKIRSNIWISTARLINSNYIKGCGPGLYSVFIPEFLTDDYKKNWGNTAEILLHSHNEILETTAETGYTGLIFFLIPFLFLVLHLIKSKFLNDDKIFWLSIILAVIGLHSLVDVASRYASSQIFVSILIGLLLTNTKEKSNTINFSPSGFSVFFKISAFFILFVLFIDNLKLIRTQFLNETMNISNIKESEKLFDKNPDVYYRKAYLEFMAEEYENSIKSYKKCLELHKNFADTRKNLSLAYYKASDINAALKTIDEDLLINQYNERAQKIKLLIKP